MEELPRPCISRPENYVSERGQKYNLIHICRLCSWVFLCGSVLSCFTTRRGCHDFANDYSDTWMVDEFSRRNYLPEAWLTIQLEVLPSVLDLCPEHPPPTTPAMCIRKWLNRIAVFVSPLSTRHFPPCGRNLSQFITISTNLLWSMNSLTFADVRHKVDQECTTWLQIVKRLLAWWWWTCESTFWEYWFLADCFLSRRLGLLRSHYVNLCVLQTVAMDIKKLERSLSRQINQFREVQDASKPKISVIDTHKAAEILPFGVVHLQQNCKSSKP